MLAVSGSQSQTVQVKQACPRLARGPILARGYILYVPQLHYENVFFMARQPATLQFLFSPHGCSTILALATSATPMNLTPPPQG